MMSENPEVSEATVSEEEIGLVKEIMRTLTKTVKTFTVYPKGNPVYVKFAEEMADRFNAFFEVRESLELNVEQYSLLYAGKEVFTSEERTNNIALSLYVDGVRQIAFHKGLQIDEIADFLDILRVSPKDRSEDDLVTLMWERDFEHLSYFVPEELASGEIAGEDSLIHEIESKERETAGGSSYLGFEVKVMSSGVVAAPISEDDIESIKQEAAALKGDPLLLSTLDLILELMVSEGDISSFSEYCRSIGMAFDFMLETANLSGAVEILKKLRHFLESLTVPELRDSVDKLVSRAGAVEKLSAVMKLTTDLQALGEYMSLLNKDAVPGLIEALGSAEDRRLRRQICGYLAPFVKADTAPFMAALKDSRWYLVRNMMTIVGISKEPAGIDIVKKALQHPDIRVKKEALKALAAIPSEGVKGPLMTLLKDPDAGIRINALRVLRKFGGSDLYLYVLESVLKDDFKAKDFNEKKESLEALGEIGREKAFQVLSGLFKKKGFFSRQDNIEMRACAAYGLGFVRTPEAVSLLKGEADSKHDALRAACQSALKGVKA